MDKDLKCDLEQLYREEREIRKEQQELERLRQERLIEREAYRKSMDVTYQRIQLINKAKHIILERFRGC